MNKIYSFLSERNKKEKGGFKIKFMQNTNFMNHVDFYLNEI